MKILLHSELQEIANTILPLRSKVINSLKQLLQNSGGSIYLSRGFYYYIDKNTIKSSQEVGKDMSTLETTELISLHISLQQALSHQDNFKKK